MLFANIKVEKVIAKDSGNILRCNIK